MYFMPDKSNSTNRQVSYAPDRSKIEEEIRESEKLENKIKKEESSSLPNK